VPTSTPTGTPTVPPSPTLTTTPTPKPTATATVELSFTEQAVQVFETGYFLVTGSSTAEDRWIPRVFSKEDYERFIDENAGGDPELKAALAFCCEETPDGLELIIKGSEASPTVIASLAHEAGHARHRVINPNQSGFSRDTAVGAVGEAMAYALEAAIVRKLGEYTGVNATLIPVESTASSVIRDWTAYVQENISDVALEHTRGHALLWLSVLRDPALADLKTELDDRHTLSPESLFLLHEHFVGMNPDEIEEYTSGLFTEFQNDRKSIEVTLLSRLATVPLEGFVRHSFEVFLMP
jgi:hypothetical protein